VTFLNNSGSFAMFTAIRRASSFVSNFAADRHLIPCYHRPVLPTAELPENLPTPTNSIIVYSFSA